MCFSTFPNLQVISRKFCVISSFINLSVHNGSSVNVVDIVNMNSKNFIITLLFYGG